MATVRPLLPLDLDPASGFGRRVAKWAAGLGMSALILFTIAHVQLTEVEVPPPPLADLQTVILNDIPPPRLKSLPGNPRLRPCWISNPCLPTTS